MPRCLRRQIRSSTYDVQYHSHDSKGYVSVTLPIARPRSAGFVWLGVDAQKPGGGIGYAQFYSRSHEVSDCEGRQGFRGLTLGPVFQLSTALHFNNRLSARGDVLAAAAKETSTQNPRLVTQKTSLNA